MRHLTAWAAAALLLFTPLRAAAADPYREVSLALGQGLVALFPPLEGYVVTASGGDIYVDLAAKDLLRPGMELQIYRPGEEMIHPVTKERLGTYEKSLGVVRITEVREKYSRGTLDATGEDAGVVGGDRVRLSSRRLRALLHVSGAAPGVDVGPLAQALVARGEESGRFSMVDEHAWAGSLAGLGAPWEAVPADPALLRRLGEAAAADLLLLARIEPGAVPQVALDVRSLRTGTSLGELRERWPAAAAAPAPAPAPRAAAPGPAGGAAVPTSTPPAPAQAPATTPAEGEYTVRDLPGPVKALAAGNLLGEGKTEVVISDGSRISVYRWEEASLAWRWEEAGKGGRLILSLDAGDLDGDGRSEVVVTSVRQGRVRSEVRRWLNGSLAVAGSLDGVYLRLARRPQGGVALLGQRSGVADFLAGRVEEYRWSGKAPERIDGSALPGGVDIFGLALAPVGGNVAYYSLDRQGLLHARTAQGKSVWRSARPYGGYPPPAREPFAMATVEIEAFEESARIFQGRLLAEASAGGVRLAVPRNFSDSPFLLVRQRILGQGEVVILEGPGESPAEARRSQPFEGYVADIAPLGVDGGGVAGFFIAVNHSGGALVGERGKLVLWRTWPSSREKN